MNRICYGVELEPKFVDVVVERYIQSKDGNAEDVFLERDGECISYKDVPKPKEES